MYKAFIFDRDGVLNRTTQILRAHQKEGDPTDGYVLSPDELELFPQVAPALALTHEKGIRAFVFTQQNCIGKGLVTMEEIAQVHARLNEQIAPAQIEEFYVAPHRDHPRAKPSPLMIEEILTKIGGAPSDVVVFGDSMRDYKAAMAAGTPFVWVRDDLGRVPEAEMAATGCPVTDHILAAVEGVLHAPGHRVQNRPAGSCIQPKNG